MPDVKVCRMQMSDLDQIMEIEHESFSMPWSRWMFERELEDPERSHFFVVKDDKKVMGYIGFWIVFDEAHIVTIAVRKEHRHKGFGTMLMSYALMSAVQLGATRATLEVRTSNFTAQSLYEKFGFERISIRKGFYTDTGEDAYIMWLADIDEKIDNIRNLWKQSQQKL
jgi:ribosomal-protein-alanine N-acetyltransferase